MHIKSHETCKCKYTMQVCNVVGLHFVVAKRSKGLQCSNLDNTPTTEKLVNYSYLQLFCPM
jgi:hypothetical protein